MQQTLSNSFMLLKVSFLNDAYFCMCIKNLPISNFSTKHFSFFIHFQLENVSHRSFQLEYFPIYSTWGNIVNLIVKFSTATGNQC